MSSPFGSLLPYKKWAHRFGKLINLLPLRSGTVSGELPFTSHRLQNSYVIMQAIYEDNHLIVVNKESGEIVQGDKTGDRPLSEVVKDYLKAEHHKPGNVFLGVVHRLDRPVSGLVVFAKTSKALTRMNKMFADGEVHKTYWAIVCNEQVINNNEELASHRAFHQNTPLEENSSYTRLTHWLVRNERQNKSYAYDHEVRGSKKAVLDYRVLRRGDRYSLVEVRLLTGRHHQIRCQLAAAGMVIRGDLKYGAPRSNADGSISLLSRHVEFQHPVSKAVVALDAPLPKDGLWEKLGGVKG